MRVEENTPQTTYLKDYRPYPFMVQRVDLHFDMQDGKAVVTSTLSLEKKSGAGQADLFLNGEELKLRGLEINGKNFTAFSQCQKGLTIAADDIPAGPFTLKTVVEIKPGKNTRLEGLYMSGGNYCTQCEAEGFRRITFYPDRPDVLSVFTMRIEADKEKHPVLLSNGNLIEAGDLTPHPSSPLAQTPSPPGRGKDGKSGQGEGLRHYAIWHDRFPKPCYLFALVAGKLNVVEDVFTTKSDRKVDLKIFVRPGDEPQCAHAMDSLKKSMKWDEDVYGLEYDLDVFNIVAVSDFNMGAMENKSLNIFNTALVLAHPDTATDSDFMRVESVIAHEYFHNWSGNRVTCRDWFQLSLKEGLTVFRDQEFSADLHSRAMQRIDDVMHLRRFQFTEDAGPLAHPVRPDQYIEINNFYTMTVYEKGAELIRMMRTLMGPDLYRKGTDLYFKRHDGQAVTYEDFVACMEEASGLDLTQFRLWYTQAGTPEVTFNGLYDEDKKTYTIALSQHIPDTPGQKNKQPMHIPVAIGLLDYSGCNLITSSRTPKTEGSIDVSDGTLIINLTKPKQTFIFENIETPPVPSIFRHFSAPVRLHSNLSSRDLAVLMQHDTDGFNRFDAGQVFMLRHLNQMVDSGGDPSEEFLSAYESLLQSALKPDTDKALMARMISLPDLPIIAQERKMIDPAALYAARERALNAIVDRFADMLGDICGANRPSGPYKFTSESCGRRLLHNTAFLIRANRLTDQDALDCKHLYDSATNMTDRMAALYLACALRDESIIEDFYKRFETYPLVIDKWFSAQAMIAKPNAIDVVRGLKNHPAFNLKNPNRARALYGAFAMNNPVQFHRPDGAGYQFLADAIIELNAINPQIAARLLTPLRDWKRYTPGLQALMKTALEEVLAQPQLSPDVFEIASKSLNA